MRTLLHIPILHTKADLGALGALLDRIKVPDGEKRRKPAEEMVEAMWDAIEHTVESLPLEPGTMRVYQDGLPVCAQEREIVRDLAAAGSRNYRLLIRLEERGAILMGTESPEMLIQEYQLAASMMHAAGGSELRRRQQLGAALLLKRDRFIAGRINNTLQPGETGILLVGMLHSVQRYLERDIDIHYPVGRI